MDTLNLSEIEAQLSRELSCCEVSCTINSDRTLSIHVAGPDFSQFTLASIDWRLYRGEDGVNRLTREIMQDVEVFRQIFRQQSAASMA
ncbi:hypothetical protein ACW9H6_20070 [Pseudomonas sp. SDO528_S397]